MFRTNFEKLFSLSCFYVIFSVIKTLIFRAGENYEVHCRSNKSYHLIISLSSLVTNKSINTDGTVSGSWIGENRQKLEKMMKRKYRQSQDVIPGEE